jgi:signal transduction histidine kinase
MMLAILSAAAALLALILGGVVGVRGRHRLANVSFAAGMAGLAAVQLGHAALLLWPGHAVPAFAVASIAGLAMLPAWARFAVTFGADDPRAEARRWAWPVGLATALAAGLLGVSGVFPFALEVPATEGAPVLTLTALGKAAAILGLLVSVFAMFQIEATLRNSSGAARWSIKYFVLALFGVFGIHVFVLSQQLLFGRFLPEHVPIHSAILLLSLGLMALALVRHRLLEVEVFVSRQVVYNSLVVAAVGVYLFGLGLAGEVLSHLGIDLDVFVIAVAVFASAMLLVVGLLSEQVRSRVKHTINRHFYRRKYDHRQEWADFTAHVSSLEKPDAIPGCILERVAETLAIPRGALWLRLDDQRWHLAASVGMPSETLPLDPSSALSGTGAGPIARIRIPGIPLTRAVRLETAGELVGLLALGEPRHGTFTFEDEELVATLAKHAAAVILNARLSERLAQAREREAYHRLSTFVLHDLKNCVAMLSLVSQNAERHGSNPEFQQEAFRAVAESVRQMQDLIGKLATLPRQVEVGGGPSQINKLVEEVVARGRSAAGARVDIFTELDSSADAVRAGDDAVRTIAANLLLNAVEALGESGRIDVRTMREGPWVTVTVADTGAGMPDEFVRTALFVPLRTTKPTGLGIGLYQVKTIVDALGGRIRVESRPGRGTTFWVDLPASENRR